MFLFSQQNLLIIKVNLISVPVGLKVNILNKHESNQIYPLYWMYCKNKILFELPTQQSTYIKKPYFITNKVHFHSHINRIRDKYKYLNHPIIRSLCDDMN